MKIRILYAVATLLLLLTEVFIALYVQDDFMRPYAVGCVILGVYEWIRTRKDTARKAG